MNRANCDHRLNGENCLFYNTKQLCLRRENKVKTFKLFIKIQYLYRDKIFVSADALCALSAGGKEEAYQADGYLHFTIKELLRPLEQMAATSGMRCLAIFALFGSRTAVEEERII